MGDSIPQIHSWKNICLSLLTRNQVKPYSVTIQGWWETPVSWRNQKKKFATKIYVLARQPTSWDMAFALAKTADSLEMISDLVRQVP